MKVYFDDTSKRFNYSLNTNFKIGDEVTTDFFLEERNVIRTITDIKEDDFFLSRKEDDFFLSRKGIKCSINYTGVISPPEYREFPEWIDAGWLIPVKT